ncbi:MAG: hypothetical protein DRN17_01775 [Thermoplasmata archaeon]|nr:MAG: hypothetical protein DRN17_01775 [Thermoplasmata archaeon]
MKIDLNKLYVKPVINLAKKKADKLREDTKKKVERLEKRLLPVEDESEERFRREEAYEKVYVKYEELDDDPYYTLEGFNIPATEMNVLLAGLSRNYLKMNPKYGIPILKEAYHEYYGTGRKCAYCGEVIPPGSGKGRTKRYCNNRCRQRAYRARKKRENKVSAVTKW